MTALGQARMNFNWSPLLKLIYMGTRSNHEVSRSLPGEPVLLVHAAGILILAREQEGNGLASQH